MVTKNDDVTTKADELLAARRSALQPLVPPTGITLRPLDVPSVMANSTRHVNQQTTSENVPAAATGDGAPHET